LIPALYPLRRGDVRIDESIRVAAQTVVEDVIPQVTQLRMGGQERRLEIDKRVVEVKHVLTRILQHLIRQGSLVPEVGRVKFHFGSDAGFLSVGDAQVPGEQSVQAEVEVLIEEAVLGLSSDESMGDLSVKETLALESELRVEGSCVFTEVMADFDDGGARKDLSG
jgi:hypothetical protein